MNSVAEKPIFNFLIYNGRILCIPVVIQGFGIRCIYMESKDKIGVLFVCLGNICRSPTAHGVFEHKVKHLGLEHSVHVDSAGTAAYHVGNPPDERSTAVARKRGYELSHLRARQAVDADFHRFDYILAMDQSNYDNLRALAPADGKARLALFLEFAGDVERLEVPDPYYGGEQGFNQVLDLVEAASEGLLADIQRRLRSAG